MQGNKLRILEREVIAFIREHTTENVVVSFSGGKDSLVVLDLAVRAGINRAVFADTTIEFKETVEYVKTMGNFFGIKIDIVKAPKDFFEVARKIGFPSRRRRWCCDVFKFGPLAKYAAENDVHAFVTGLRKDESYQRTKYTRIDKNPIVPVTQLNPILEWSEKEVWSYIKKYELPVNPLYKYLDRIGCWCCPFKTRDEFEKIKHHFPQLYAKFRNELLAYAEILGIKDKRKFVDEFGWTMWASPVNRSYGGFSTPCSEGKPMRHLVFLENKMGEAVTKLLPILTDKFEVHDGGNIICVPTDIPYTKLNILVEKAINCVGCGACTATCKNNALCVENGYLEVRTDKCTHCLACLNTNLLKGACVFRNYSITRISLTRM